MRSFRLSITTPQRKALDRKLKTAQQRGDLRTSKFALAVLAVAHYAATEQVALVLQLSVAQVEHYAHQFLCYGVAGVAFKPAPGRPPKLTKTQKRQLSQFIEDGPAQCGFDGNCWRSPMVQQLILDKFGVTYNVFYIAELLKNLGFSYQKAAFVSDHLKRGGAARVATSRLAGGVTPRTRKASAAAVWRRSQFSAMGYADLYLGTERRAAVGENFRPAQRLQSLWPD